MVSAERTRPDRRQSAETIAIGLVLALQLVLPVSSYAESGVRPAAATLAAPFVCLALLIGYASGQHRSLEFNALVFSGWTILMGAGYALEPSRETAPIGGLVGAIAIYYVVRYVTDGPESDDGDSNSDPDSSR